MNHHSLPDRDAVDRADPLENKALGRVVRDRLRRAPLRGHVLRLVAVIAYSVAAPASAEVLWRGDFETGDLSQWSKTQVVAADRLVVVEDPLRQGNHAVLATVRFGDDPIDASGHRSELVYSREAAQEVERVYAWSTLWPPKYRSTDRWQLFTQWHQESNDGSPPMVLYVRGEEVTLGVDWTDVWSAPLVRGRWHQFVVRVFWSTDPGRGFVELWYDGRRALRKRPARTLIPGTGGVYLKQGLYRKETITWDQAVFHDDMIIATHLADVLPPGAALDPELDEEPAAVSPAPLASAGTHPDTTIVSAEPVGCSQGHPAALAALGVGLRWRRRRT